MRTAISLLLIGQILHPTFAYASTWDPAALVNSESQMTIDDGDGTTDIELRFGDSFDGIIRYSPTDRIFETTRGMTVGGNLTATGSLSVRGGDIRGSGALAVDGDMTLNEDNTAADAILTFGNDAGAETLRFSDTINEFIFSDDLYVQGRMSGASLSVAGGNVTVTNSGAAVFNEQGRDVDFRVEGDTNENLFFLDASSGNVGIGTSSPTNALEVVGSMSGRSLQVTGTGARPLIFTDVTTGRVGIGTTTPAAMVEILDSRPDEYLSAFNNAAGSRLVFRRARGAVGAPTAITAGNSIGGIAGMGYGDTAFSPSRASISIYAAENWTDARQGTELRFSITQSGGTTPLEPIRVTGHGRVGINTTTPRNTLEVRGSVSGSTLTVSNLNNCDSIDTDGNGNLVCGSDGGGFTQQALDSRFVNTSGDTMTGSLRIRNGGGLTASGTVQTDGNMGINVENGAADAILTFGNDLGAETLHFSDTKNSFIFSDDVEIRGVMSGSQLWVGSGVTLNQVRYEFPKVRGQSGTVLRENGAGTLTWGPPGKAGVFVDTTAESLTDANVDLWDGTFPNITPSSASASILVSLMVSGTSDAADDEVDVFTIRRAINANPDCTSTNIDGLFSVHTTVTGVVWSVSPTILDKPASTGNVRYTVCSDTAATGTLSNDTVRITFSLVEVGW